MSQTPNDLKYTKSHEWVMVLEDGSCLVGITDHAQDLMGDMVYVEGKLRTRSWEKDGVTRYTTEVVADNMTMLSTRGSGSSSGGDSGYASSNKGNAEGYSMPADTGGSDDLPF